MTSLGVLGIVLFFVTLLFVCTKSDTHTENWLGLVWILLAVFFIFHALFTLVIREKQNEHIACDYDSCAHVKKPYNVPSEDSTVTVIVVPGCKKGQRHGFICTSPKSNDNE